MNIFFINYKTFINSNISHTISNIHNNYELFFEELKNFKIYNDQTYNCKIYKIFFRVFLYFIIRIENNIYLIINNNDDKYIKEKMNHIIYYFKYSF